MKKIHVVLAAFPLEVQSLLDAYDFYTISPTRFRAVLHDYDIEVWITGQGKVQTALIATEALWTIKTTDKLCYSMVLVGSAGELNPAVKDWCWVEECIEHDFHSERSPRFRDIWDSFPNDRLNPEISGKLQRVCVLSQESNVQGLLNRLNLHDETEADIVTWESAGFARFIQKHRKSESTRFLELRYISDRGDDSLDDFKQLKQIIQEQSRSLPMILETYWGSL